MPVLLPRCEPDHVTRPDLLDLSTVTLNPPETNRDNHGLTNMVGRLSAARLAASCVPAHSSTTSFAGSCVVEPPIS